MSSMETAIQIDSYVSLVGTALSCPPPDGNTWWQKLWDARLALIELKLPEAIDAIAEFPIVPEELEYPEDDGASRVIGSQRKHSKDLAKWLRSMMLEGEAIPEAALEARHWEKTGILPSSDAMLMLHRFASAQLSIETYKLAKATHSRVPKLYKLFPFPVSLWACIECSNSRFELRISGITDNPVIFGKDRFLNHNANAIRKYQDMKVEAVKEGEELAEWMREIHESEKLLSTLVSEACKIAKEDWQFDEKHHQPFLRLSQRVNNLTKNNEQLQAIHRLPHGEVFTTGKNSKIPNELKPKEFEYKRSRE